MSGMLYDINGLLNWDWFLFSITTGSKRQLSFIFNDVFHIEKEVTKTAFATADLCSIGFLEFGYSLVGRVVLSRFFLHIMLRIIQKKR